MAQQTESQQRWQQKNLRKGSGYVFKGTRSKYTAFFASLREKPNEEWHMATMGSIGAASVLAWRVNQGFYGEGFSARISGCEVIARFGPKIDGRVKQP